MRRSSSLTLAVLAALSLAPLGQAQAGILLPGANARITDAGQLDAWVGEPDVAALGLTLYATWRDARRTDSRTEADIVFAKSTDGGASWSANTIVSNSQYVGFTNNPSISVSPDGTIWIAWGLDACYDVSITCGGSELNNDVRAAWSYDGGTTWAEGTLWNGSPAGIGDSVTQRPEIAAQDDRIYTVVHDPTFNVGGDLIGFNVVVHEITRAGTSLTSGFVLLTPGGATGRLNTVGGPLTALAVRGNTVCVAWEDQRDAASIYGACSTNRGVSFPAAARWSTNGADTEPRLAFAPDGRLVLSYKDLDKKDVFVRTSTDAGSTWSAAHPATAVGSAYTFAYDLTVGPDNQIVVPIAVGALSTADETDLEVATSIDGGLTFAQAGPLEAGPEPFLSISTQSRLAVATTGDAAAARAHIVWADDRGDPLGTQYLIWSADAALDSLAPSTPTNPRATGGDTSILVQWDAATDANGVAAYDVQRAPTPGGSFSRINARPVTQLFFRDVGLTAGSYAYRVVAIDGTGNASAPSAAVSATVTVGGPVSGLNGVLAYDTAGGVGVRTLTSGVPGVEATLAGMSYPNYSTDGLTLYLRGNPTGTVYAGDRSGGGAKAVFSDAQTIGVFDLPVDVNIIAGVFQDDFNGACVPFEARLVRNTPRSTLVTTSNTNVEGIAVSPDGRWVAYTNRLYCTVPGTTQYDSNRLCVIDAPVAVFKETCLPPANVRGTDFGNAGNLLVFSADYSGQNEIWRASIDGSGVLYNYAQLTRGAAGQPALYPRVSSDGNWVAFLRDVDPGAGQDLRVCVVRVDGDSVRGLGFAAQSIVWSGGGPAAPIVGLDRRLYLPSLRR